MGRLRRSISFWCHRGSHLCSAPQIAVPKDADPHWNPIGHCSNRYGGRTNARNATGTLDTDYNNSVTRARFPWMAGSLVLGFSDGPDPSGAGDRRYVGARLLRGCEPAAEKSHGIGRKTESCGGRAEE